MRNLVSGLLEHKSIITTEKRALAITPVVERIIEVAKSTATEYNKIRTISSEVFTEAASRAAIALAPQYADRKGGYTRITPIKYRDGDAALLVKIELI